MTPNPQKPEDGTAAHRERSRGGEPRGVVALRAARGAE